VILAPYIHPKSEVARLYVYKMTQNFRSDSVRQQKEGKGSIMFQLFVEKSISLVGLLVLQPHCLTREGEIQLTEREKTYEENIQKVMFV